MVVSPWLAPDDPLRSSSHTLWAAAVQQARSLVNGGRTHGAHQFAVVQSFNPLVS
jgi:hypothetical protein